MRRVAVINQKGGVGKTTTTVNLGAALARQGKRVLLLDMDPQANLTVHLDCKPGLEGGTMTSLLLDDAPLTDLVVSTQVEGLGIIPADTSLAGIEQVLANRIGRETILREALDAYEQTPGGSAVDYVLMDCPPSLGVLSANALVNSDRVLVPVQAEYLALQGMAKLMEVVELVKRRLNSDLQVGCILPCMVDQRTNLSAEVLDEIQRHFGTLLARTRIRANVKLAEAPSFGQDIFRYAPDSNGAADYAAFAEEFVQIWGDMPAAQGQTPSQSHAPAKQRSQEEAAAPEAEGSAEM